MIGSPGEHLIRNSSLSPPLSLCLEDPLIHETVKSNLWNLTDYREKVATAFHEFHALVPPLTGNGHDMTGAGGLSNGSTVSPAGSHSSASSGVLGNRDNGAPNSGPNASGQPLRSVTVVGPLIDYVSIYYIYFSSSCILSLLRQSPTPCAHIVFPSSSAQQLQKAMVRSSHLQRAFDLWYQSCNYINDTNNKGKEDICATMSTLVYLPAYIYLQIYISSYIFN